MAHKSSSSGPVNNFEFNETSDDMDIVMSQISMDFNNANNGNSTDTLRHDMLGEDLDDVDEVMSQIDTEAMQMEQGIAGDQPKIPQVLLNGYQNALDGILPSRSANRYLQAYDVFTKWQTSQGTASFDEKVVMSYFYERKMKLNFKPSTLWSVYSMLKKTLILKHSIDISKYSQLVAWLKKQSDGFTCKQSNVFTAEQISKFVTEAPNNLYFAMKVRQWKLNVFIVF
jgi:hypothetical protein